MTPQKETSKVSFCFYIHGSGKPAAGNGYWIKQTAYHSLELSLFVTIFADAQNQKHQ